MRIRVVFHPKTVTLERLCLPPFRNSSFCEVYFTNISLLAMLRPMIVRQNYFQGQDIAFLSQLFYVVLSMHHCLKGFHEENLKKHCNIPTLHGNWS